MIRSLPFPRFTQNSKRESWRRRILTRSRYLRGLGIRQSEVRLPIEEHLSGRKLQAADLIGALWRRRPAKAPQARGAQLREELEPYRLRGSPDHLRLILEQREADLQDHEIAEVVDRLFEGLSIATQIHLESERNPLLIFLKSQNAESDIAEG